MIIRRGFADIGSGVQVHYRTAGSGGARPLVILHPSPGSAKMMEALIAAYAPTREVFALDTLGNGDSSAPSVAQPDLAYFARSHMAAIDALCLGEFDLHGSHTGASIASEIALAWPARVRHLILDGVPNFIAAQRSEMLANHAPPLTIAADASHLLWVWNFVRDAFLFWPWYKRDRENLRGIGLPSTDALHDKFVEVIKAARTFHLSYNAAIAHDHADRLPRLSVPTLLACARDDMLLAYFDAIAAMIPNGRTYVYPGLQGSDGVETLARLTAFLDDST